MIPTSSFVLCILMLSYACYSDLRTRTVSNKVWGVFFVAALPITLYKLIVGDVSLFHTVAAVLLVYGVGVTLFHLHVFGGADAKALIALAFLYSSPLLPVMVLLFASLYVLIATATYYFTHPSATLSNMRHIRVPFFLPMLAAYPISLFVLEHL